MSPEPEVQAGSRNCEQLLDDWPLRAVQAMLGDAAAAIAGSELPPLWHWFYFLQAVPREQLGIDGHPRLPDSSDGAPPRRMFAAARIQIDQPLRVGERAAMSVAITATRDTTGSSGPLRIVTYEHRYQQHGQLCIVEQRDIVYRSGGAGATRAPGGATIEPRWRRQVTPDAAMLMRMSALTFNSHRIHYDQAYAQQQEGYPERVVHAPLTALLLAEHLRVNGSQRLRRLEFRARSPLFVDQPIELLASPADGRMALQAIAPSGLLAMEASAWW